jgi:integrase/recombinase XerD
MKVTLMIRVRMGGSASRKVCKPVFAANGRLKPLYAIVGSKAEHRPEGVYVLRYRTGGRRVFETVGSDPTEAVAAQRRREHVLKAEKLGLEVVGQGVTTAVPPAPAAKAPAKRRVADCVAEYLAETAQQKAHKTNKGYAYDLRVFQQHVTTEFMEDVGRAEMLHFMNCLRRAGNAPRTVFNRVQWIGFFFRHFGLEHPCPKRDIPKYTEKVAAAYNTEELRGLFEEAGEDRLLWEFFLASGGRDQEVQYAAWSEIDFVSGVWSIKAKPDLGWTLKDHEERAVPLPDKLLADLKARRAARPDDRFLFPSRKGGGEIHFLRKLKRTALAAGLNCRHCVNKQGLSCADHPVCKRWELHKFRKTFAFMHHEAGVSARTLMAWLGHADLETTLGYLTIADVRSGKTRAQVNSTFAAL